MTPLDPDYDCPDCPRLVAFRNRYRQEEPDWFNGPVPSFGDINGALLIVGLAPGLRGANRTSRPFTGDYAGDLLYQTLGEFGFAKGHYDKRPDDGLTLHNVLITNAVRCVPPENKPIGAEINTCRPYLTNTIAAMTDLKVILTLGKIAHDTTVRMLGYKLKDIPFGHGNAARLDNGLTLVDSYHCSRYNTNTGRLTEDMFRSVFQKIRDIL
ncbi:uracil-DNA glycosylase [Coralliovum pocilloporae]|uniref:uracil-DNA glycosylase n=1 Tax=Coralliovum pocilloporae TaxID=3066369 RepID=UPI0033074CD9